MAPATFAFASGFVLRPCDVLLSENKMTIQRGKGEKTRVVYYRIEGAEAFFRTRDYVSTTQKSSLSVLAACMHMKTIRSFHAFCYHRSLFLPVIRIWLKGYSK